ncbi:11356_t:CDS:10 [Rhizophagus irregularis]|nr:11356_t:CDS:10 [Rhizophagus irregularis]
MRNVHMKLSEKTSTEFWLKVALTVFLVLIGGLFAGLTLGLMSLDETNLHILASSGDPKQQKYAARIQPIRKNGHLLLVTLLLANVIVNETLPIVMDDVLGGGGITAVLASTALIVVFGEIIPQSVCSRYGLAVGAFFAWPVRILIWLTFVFSYPIAKLLDWVLGEDHGIIYRRAELKELIKYHESSERGGDLMKDSVTIIRGALDLQDKVVENAMTPIDKAYMISIDSILDRITIREIYTTGHSRIPVYEGSRDNILGVLIPTVEAKTPLFDILNTFQEGKSHMSLVFKEGVPVGIITLEDVLEELIQEEIYDESDVRTGLAVKLETGGQLILSSKRKRTSSLNNNKGKFKSSSSHPLTRANTDTAIDPKIDMIGDTSKNDNDLIIFDEPEHKDYNH